MQNLTTGNITKQLIFLALPLIIGNIFQQFYNTIDAVIIGRYVNESAFAGIGIASTVMNIFIFIISGACTGISIILAQYFGAKDLISFKKECFISLVFGSLFTILISVIAIFSLNYLLQTIQTPLDIFQYTYDYLIVIFLGLIATFLYNFYSAILRSIGDTLASLIFLAISVIINLVLDLFFIAYLQLSVKGAGFATVLSQFLSVIFCYIYLKIKYKNLSITKHDMIMDLTLLKRTLRLSFVTALHQSSIYIGKLCVQGAVNLLDTPIIAAYTATTRIEGYANSFGDSGSSALSIFIAQNVGGKLQKRITKAFLTSIVLLAILGIICSTIMYFTATYSMMFMLGTNTGIAFTEGVSYIKVISLFYIFCFTGNALVGYFDGFGKVHIPVIGATSHIILRVVGSFMFIQIFGLNTVAVATGIGWIMVNILWFIIYLVNRKSYAKSLN